MRPDNSLPQTKVFEPEAAGLSLTEMEDSPKRRYNSDKLDNGLNKRAEDPSLLQVIDTKKNSCSFRVKGCDIGSYIR